ncbi:hypothetical protein ACLMJK_005474 [Lecanora helva]
MSSSEENAGRLSRTSSTLRSKRRMFPLERAALSINGLHAEDTVHTSSPILNGFHADDSVRPSPNESRKPNGLQSENHRDDGGVASLPNGLHHEDTRYDGSFDDNSSSTGTVKTSINHSDLENPAVTNRQSEYPDANLLAPKNSPATPNGEVSTYQNGTTFASAMPSKKISRSRLRFNSLAEVVNNDYNGKRKVSRSLPDLRAVANGIVKDPSLTNPLSPKAVDTIPLNDRIQRIDTWDTSVKLYTTTKLTAMGDVEVRHHVTLSVDTCKLKISADRVSLCLYMFNGMRNDRTCSLDRGQSSIFLENSISLPSSGSHEAKLDIIRDSHDLESPFDLYLQSIHPLVRRTAEISIPTFCPAKGKVLSESVFVGVVNPFLRMKPILRDNLSTWKVEPYGPNRLTCFQRREMPRLYPAGFKDDLRLNIVELARVKFQSIGNLTAADVAWDLDIKVEGVLSMRLECHMSLWLEIGEPHKTLLVVDPHGWTPKFFLVGNRLTTEASGEWREDGGRFVLLKDGNMHCGPTKIEMTWQRGSNTGFDEGMPLLPSIVDRQVLSGTFTSRDGTTTVHNDDATADDPWLVCGEFQQKRLPTMAKGTSLRLSRAGEQPAKLATSHPRKRDIAFQLGVVLGLIFGLFIGLRHVRQVNEWQGLQDSGLSSSSNYEGIRGSEPAIASTQCVQINPEDSTQENFAGSTEGEGWRDWVDMSLGWRGVTS